MKIGEMKESKYLKKEDVGDGVLVTIKSIKHENVGLDTQPEEMKYVMYFNEAVNNEHKGIVLNWTNIQLAAKACGSEDTDDWPGKQVVLYEDPNVSFQGKLVGGIRIRAPKQPQQPAVVASENPAAGLDDIPF